MEINWRELQDYRLKEIEEGASFITDIWKSSSNPDYFRGAMEMFERIINLPTALCDKEQREFVEELIAQDYKRVEMTLLRKAIR